MKYEEKRWKKWGDGKMISKIEAPIRNYYRVKYVWNNGKIMEKKITISIYNYYGIEVWKKNHGKNEHRSYERYIWVYIKYIEVT